MPGWATADDFPFRQRDFRVSWPASMKKRLILLAACLIPGLRAEPVVAAAAAEAPEFIRVEEEGSSTRLQTAVTTYRKGDATVELIGAIHIADREYYQALNDRFSGYDALLYEGIGNPVRAVEPPTAPAAEAKKPGKFDGLHNAYQSGARWLGLSYQMTEIDYQKPNFVHADLSVEEFTTLQAERKESLLGFVLKASLQPQAKPAKEPSTLKLLTSMVRGDKDGLKRELVHTLGAGDDQIAAFAGETVIVTDRNTKCLEVLAREVASGKTHLGVFYGAAHFPDMEKRLLDDGWEKTATEWLTAWDIADAERAEKGR